MSYLEEAPDTDDRAELYAADVQRTGYVANYTKVYARRPRVYRAWRELNAAVKAEMDPVRYEVATVAAAAELRSSYCALAHGEILAGQVGEAAAVRVVAGEPSEPEQAAVATLARLVASSPADIRSADFADLRALGFDDTDLLDVVLAAAARCFFSSVLEATGAEPDPIYADLPAGLQTALTVGRPVQAGDG